MNSLRAATAEYVQTESFEEMVAQEAWRPFVIAVPELEDDVFVRRRAAHFIGSVAIDKDIITDEVRRAEPSYTLMHAVQRAAEGDRDGYEMTRMNVGTDMIERTIKSGHIMQVPMDRNENGQLQQNGQTADDIQANSLRFAASSWQMRERTEAETRNKFRIDAALRHDDLEDYAFVVFSRAADNMQKTEMDEAGFFTDTMSCAIQLTSLQDGKLSVESAFVAGKQSWDTERHDAATLAGVGDVLGVDFHDKSATELIDTPLLIHKSLLPNGVSDLVKLYDDCAGGTFFGEAKPRQDYVAYKHACAERTASFEPQVRAITDQLIAEAQLLDSPQAASQRLSQLSQHIMLERSIHDTSIDPRVFGIPAAYRIEHARYYYEIGDFDKAHTMTDQAQSVARSSSCPGGVQVGGESAGGNQSSGDSDVEDCEFTSEECPKCHKKNVKTVVKKGRYYGDCGCVG